MSTVTTFNMNEYPKKVFSLLLSSGLFLSVGTLLYLSIFPKAFTHLPPYFYLIPLSMSLFFILCVKTNLFGLVRHSPLIIRELIYWAIWSIALGIFLGVDSLKYSGALWLLVFLGFVLAIFMIIDFRKFD